MTTPAAYLEYVQARCAEHGVSLVLLPKKHTRDGDVGVFDDKALRLTVCAAREDWLPILAHECAHLNQWAERADVFMACREDDWKDYDDALAGSRRLTPRALVGVTRRIQRVELDAERRALRMIRAYKLTPDVRAYTRGANYDVWRYEIARRLGRWPEAHDEAVKLMPDRLMRASRIGDPPADFGLG